MALDEDPTRDLDRADRKPESVLQTLEWLDRRLRKLELDRTEPAESGPTGTCSRLLSTLLAVSVVELESVEAVLTVLRRRFIRKETRSFDTRKLSSCKSWLGLSKLSILTFCNVCILYKFIT